MKNLVMVLVLSLGLFQVACTKVDLASEWAAAIEEFANSSGGGPIEVEVVKDTTLRGGDWILVREVFSGEVYAFNIVLFESGMTYLEWAQAVSDAGIVDVSAGQVTYVGNGNWQDTSGNLYEETAAASKDLEKLAAFKEELNVKNMGEALSAEYGLSESRGLEVARVHNQWNKIAGSRSMTSRDAEAFASELMGVNMTKAMSAFKAAKAGNTNAWEKVLESAAVHNGTSPEHMRDIIKTFVK